MTTSNEEDVLEYIEEKAIENTTRIKELEKEKMNITERLAIIDKELVNLHKEIQTYVPSKLQVNSYSIVDDGTDMAIKYDNNTVLSVCFDDILVNNLAKQDGTPYITKKDLPPTHYEPFKGDLIYAFDECRRFAFTKKPMNGKMEFKLTTIYNDCTLIKFSFKQGIMDCDVEYTLGYARCEGSWYDESQNIIEVIYLHSQDRSGVDFFDIIGNIDFDAPVFNSIDTSIFALKSEMPSIPDHSDFALKSEIPEVPDLSTYMHTGYRPFEISPLHATGVSVYDGYTDLNHINNGVIKIQALDDAKTFDVTCSILFRDGGVDKVDLLGSRPYDWSTNFDRNIGGKDKLRVIIYKNAKHEPLNFTIIESKNYDDPTSIKHYLKKAELPDLFYKPFKGTLTTSEAEKTFSFTNIPKNGFLRFHVESDDNKVIGDMIMTFKNGESFGSLKGGFFADVMIHYDSHNNSVTARCQHHMDQSRVNSFELVENINYDAQRKVADDISSTTDSYSLVSVKALDALIARITALENK